MEAPRLSGGEEGAVPRRVASAAAAVLYASLVPDATRRRAALRLQRRFVTVRTRERLTALRTVAAPRPVVGSPPRSGSRAL